MVCIQWSAYERFPAKRILNSPFRMSPMEPHLGERKPSKTKENEATTGREHHCERNKERLMVRLRVREMEREGRVVKRKEREKERFF